MSNLFYLLIISNLFSFILYFSDKKKAIKNKNRISEFNLLLSSFLFGSLGSILAMLIFHHKTKKFKFKFFVPIFFVIHCLILFYFLKFHSYKFCLNSILFTL
ncbi:DUF1294 domain-containing protein [Peptoniphilus indolicus]|uniref:Protein of uncharacterized function (DUF1294) n=1 Tax=Peptoniphilus indolicus TaxID=33030 RepID=A0A379DBJ8_9FIRM|nr:Protein of uncharacterised function (DUF1294) [Peptoniphilus indolicus]